MEIKMKKALVGTNPLENLFRRDSIISIYPASDLSRTMNKRSLIYIFNKNVFQKKRKENPGGAGGVFRVRGE